MHQKLLYCRDEFSLLAGTFRLAVWVVTQASCLSRRTGILACFGTRRLGSLRDISGWKPKLLSVAPCWNNLWLKRAGVLNSMK